MINAVEQLALADPTTFKVLLDLVANANDLQKGALGMGLAQATKTEFLINATAGREWQQLIAPINDPAFKTAAMNGFGDVQLGAVGGGPLGGGGGGHTNPLSQGPTSSGPVQTFTSHFTPTQTFSYTSSVTSSSSQSVSP